MAQENKYFLKYQIDWLQDNSKIKIWEKSRRIGATYVQSYEDVRDCVSLKVPAVWFSSADESAAKEYILYCAKWAKLFDVSARELGEIVIDKEKDIKALVIQFSNGTRINALTSNPRAFRSKGGKVVLDEFAHHEDQVEMWKAAKPSATWGFPIRILSTHNGKGQFFKFIEGVKKKKLNWSLHTVDIYRAVEDGLVDKIMGRQTTKGERWEWLNNERRDCFDEITWQEEYCCNAQDEGSSFLDYELIGKCEESDILWNGSVIENPWNGKGILEPTHFSSKWVYEHLEKFQAWMRSQTINGSLYLGVDVGRRKDLTVMVILEKLYNINISRGYFVMENMKFWVQQKFLHAILSHPRLVRACIDETGLGMQLAETAQDSFGESRVEKINFASGSIRSDMAFGLRRELEARTLLIPALDEVKDDFHSIKKIVTSANNVRLEADKSDSEVSGHADRFWGWALANHAAKSYTGETFVATRGRRKIHKLLEGYE
ncbi:MAG: hypothetical protein HF314_12060 [Ignavibacteria bacterium]|jgi:phage FluMu gp28-like protein|nr:hypothetical protein [Ignavibacteria bacterium]MCU7503805.1 hypothetical protein [Ignavibacteria bacterium]MCU7517181.1 hypothetical protein [Ignavibacteria bacterium]